MRLRITALGIFLSILCIQPAKADTFEITGATDTSICGPLVQGCASFSYDMVLQTLPLTTVQLGGSLTDDVYWITEISGQINGLPVSTPSRWGGLLAPGFHNGSDHPILYGQTVLDVNGQPGLITNGNGRYGTLDHTVTLSVGSENAWCTYDITAVPEPSALSLLGAGLLMFLGLAWLKGQFA